MNAPRPSADLVDQARHFLTHPHIFYPRLSAAEYEDIRWTAMCTCRADLAARRSHRLTIVPRHEPGDAA